MALHRRTNKRPLQLRQGIRKGRMDPPAAVLSTVPHRRRSASLWASRMPQQLIKIGFSMWIHRKSIKHSDLSHQAQAWIRQVGDAIRSQFDMGAADLPQNIRHLLSRGWRHVLHKPLDDKETWLEIIGGETKNPGSLSSIPAEDVSKLLSPSWCPIMTLTRESTPFVFTPPRRGRAFLFWIGLSHFYSFIVLRSLAWFKRL